MTDTVAFDPGMGKLATDLYTEVYIIENDLANMPQLSRKIRYYRITYKKIVNAMLNNLAFYRGCLAWEYYITTSHKDAKLSQNPFISLSEEQKAQYAPTEVVEFFQEYLPKYKSDLKYYNVKDDSLPSNTEEILSQYREFVAMNEGFMNAHNVSDIKLPEGVVFTASQEEIKEKIDNAVSTGNLSELLTL